MSFRPALRAARSVRGFSTSAPRRGGHGHGHAQSSAADTEETFFNQTWIATFAGLAAAVLALNVLPSPSRVAASPSNSNDALAAEAENKKTPVLTRLIAGEMAGKADVWSERNGKHLELASEAADTKLLFQAAERPKVWRLRNPSSFENASPHMIGVGSQADLSDLKIKSDN